MGFVFCALIKKEHFHLEIIDKLRETILGNFLCSHYYIKKFYWKRPNFSY